MTLLRNGTFLWQLPQQQSAGVAQANTNFLLQEGSGLGNVDKGRWILQQLRSVQYAMFECILDSCQRRLLPLDFMHARTA